MSIFTTEKESCALMDFEEFQARVMESVRKQNHMNLVDSWEKHIIFKEFHQGSEPISSSLFATVYYTDSLFKKDEFKISVYSFSYHEHCDHYNFYCTHGIL